MCLGLSGSVRYLGHPVQVQRDDAGDSDALFVQKLVEYLLVESVEAVVHVQQCDFYVPGGLVRPVLLVQKVDHVERSTCPWTGAARALGPGRPPASRR